ncbi:11853_t:CDS:1, partial [Gigaspora margarita]
MYKFIVLLFIYILLINPTYSKDEDKKDNLSGFKECDGSYPNKITHFSFDPNPTVKNTTIKFEIGGTSTVPFDKGSYITGILTLKDIPKQLHVQDFCEGWVEPSGGHCPVKPGEFYFKGSQYLKQTDEDPRDVTITGYLRVV